MNLITDRSYLFIYLGFYVAFNTVQVISRRVVGRAEETSAYSSSGFCTVNCRPTASNYQLSHLRPCREPNPGLNGGRRESYHSATEAPSSQIESTSLVSCLKFKKTIILCFHFSLFYCFALNGPTAQLCCLLNIVFCAVTFCVQ